MPRPSSLNVLVVGCGAIGANHARVLADLPDAHLVAVADTNDNVARHVGEKYRCRSHRDWREAIASPDVDAVVVAVPTAHHTEVAMAAIEFGKHVLVEKPIAPTAREGIGLAAAAEKAGLCLMVGHVERFNPAVLALRRELEAGGLGRIFHVEARRQGPFPTRILDVGVAIDLAVHDVDILRCVVGEEVDQVFATTARRRAQEHEDMLMAQLFMRNGVVADLGINWLTPTKVRSLAVVGEKGMYQVDYIMQDLHFVENTAAVGPGWAPLSLLRGGAEGRVIRHVVPKQEPLRNELAAFVASIREGTEVATPAIDGVRAVEIVQALLLSAKRREIVKVSGKRLTEVA